MIIFAQTPSHERTIGNRLLGYLPGLAVGAVLVYALRFTTLDPATRVFLASLPMWILFTLNSSMAGPTYPLPSRLLRATAYGVLVSSVLYALMRLG